MKGNKDRHIAKSANQKYIYCKYNPYSYDVYAILQKQINV